MEKVIINDTIEDGVCSSENKKVKTEKKPWEDKGYDDPPFYEEFRPIWGPGSSYKPWINGK